MDQEGILDSVLHIDAQLRQLENERTTMERKLHSQQKTKKEELCITPEPQKLLIQPMENPSLQKNRYSKLPSIRVDEEEVVPVKKIKPQISKKWKEIVTTTQPKLSDMYEKEKFEPQFNNVDNLNFPPRVEPINDDLELYRAIEGNIMDYVK